MLPIMPRALEPAICGCIFQMLPIGAARFVTKEIIPKRKIITRIGTNDVFCLVVVILDRKMISD